MIWKTGYMYVMDFFSFLILLLTSQQVKEIQQWPGSTLAEELLISSLVRGCRALTTAKCSACVEIFS